MICRLIGGISAHYSRAHDVQVLFTKKERDYSDDWAAVEQPPLGIPCESCTTNLFFCFFFDGTKNNYMQAETGKNHSNVARLYDRFPGLSVKGVLPDSTDWTYNPDRYTHFFRTYIPGVASPFKEVGDSGEGMTLTMGASSGRGVAQGPNDAQNEMTQQLLMGVLKRLHKAVAQHWPGADGKPAKCDPAIVKTIYVPTFGFSRGATQARAFANWLISLCKLDARRCVQLATH